MTPYITPAMLRSAPTGVSWGGIPRQGASINDQLAEQSNICRRVTSVIDGESNQVLRATLDTETWQGPNVNQRFTIDRSGVGRALVSRWPVLSITSGQITPATAFPPAWTAIPSTAMLVEGQQDTSGTSAPPDGAGAGPAAILIAPGYVNWYMGRGGYRLSITYSNGWPHCGLTTQAAVGATTLAVDDCTGWNGLSGTIYDGLATESITVTAVSAATGPGTLTLASATLYEHAPTIASGVMISTMPEAIQQAAILLATAEALLRGASSVTAQAMAQGHSGTTQADLRKDAYELIDQFKRIL